MAFRFTTSSHYLQQTAGSGAASLPAIGTIGFMLKPNGWGAGSTTTRCLFCQTAASGQLVQMTQTLGLWYIGWSNSSHIQIAVANIGIVANVWNSIVFRWNNSTGVQEFYVGGVLRGTDSTGLSTESTSGQDRRWGAHTTGYGTAVVDGDMSHCFVANGYITVGEITNLMTKTPPNAISSVALMQYFSTDGSTVSGTTVNAQVGTNGVLVGSPSIVSGPSLGGQRSRDGLRQRGWCVR